jgi:hypothetical protein
LDDASAALSTQVRQRSTNGVDRADQIGCHGVFDLLDSEFLGYAEQAVPILVPTKLRSASVRTNRSKPVTPR